MATRRKRTATFTAHSADGREYTIHAITEYFVTDTLDGPGGLMANRLDLKTQDGKPVSHVAKGKYTIFGIHGEIPLTSDDPNAP